MNSMIETVFPKQQSEFLIDHFFPFFLLFARFLLMNECTTCTLLERRKNSFLVSLFVSVAPPHSCRRTDATEHIQCEHINNEI